MMTDDAETPAMNAQTDAAEPIDAEFEPARDAAPRVERVNKRGPGWLSSFMMMLLASAGGGVIGYGAALYAPEWRGTPGLESLAEQQDANASALGDLSERLDGLEDEASQQVRKPAQAEPETRLSALRAEIEDMIEAGARERERGDKLARRVAILEGAGERDGASPEEVTRSLSALNGRVDALSARLEGLDEGIGAGASTTERIAGEAAAMSQEITMLKAQISGLRDTVEALASQPQPEAGSLGKAALALSQIEAAARRGQPFPGALADLSAAMPDAAPADALGPIASTGAPTIETLAADFPAIAVRVRKAGQDATDSQASGLAGRVFGDFIEVRRDEDIPASQALDTAGTALETGDLGGAIAALERLEGKAGEAAAPWLEAARKRRTLERSLDMLRLELMRQEP